MQTNLIGIYSITAPSGSKYIGMTRNSFSARWNEHLKLLRSGNHPCKGILRAFNKYGKDSLKFDILEIASTETQIGEVRSREQFWWDYFKAQKINLYNGRPTEFGSVEHTEESKEKIKGSLAEFHKGKTAIQVCLACQESFKAAVKRGQIYCSKACVMRGKTARNRKLNASKEDLIRLYWTEEKSAQQISDIYNVSRSTIEKAMERFKISKRTVAQAITSRGGAVR